MNPDANAADTPYTTKAYEAYDGPVEIDAAEGWRVTDDRF
jgi:hypothetical protein